MGEPHSSARPAAGLAVRKVLVTGAGGYIGSVLVEALLDSGYEVVALDRFFFGDTLAPLTGRPALRVLRRDVRDVQPEELDGVDAVCDLAALSNDPAGDLDAELTRSINHQARARLAALAREAGVQRYLLASSCSVYGAGEHAHLDEASVPRPLTVYAESNLAAERDILSLATPSFTPTALRNATVFGVSPRMRFDLVINLMTLHAFERNRILVMGGGRQWRPLVHVRDVARAFQAVLGADPARVSGHAFNVGLGNFQVRTLAAIVREVLPFPVSIEIAPDDADRRNYAVSFDKLQAAVDYRPELTVEHGVAEVYEALKHGRIEASPRTSTVGWYQSLLEARRLLDSVMLDGRLL